MSSNLRTRTAGVLFTLGVLTVASAVVGAVGHYAALDRPIPFGATAASLIIVSMSLVVGGRARGPVIALTMIWTTVGLVTYVTSWQVYDRIPGPAGSGLEVRVLHDGDWSRPEWTLMVHKDDGLLTREWPLVERLVSEHDNLLPAVTWIDPSHVRLSDRPGDDRAPWGEQVVVLDAGTGRPLRPDHPVRRRW